MIASHFAGPVERSVAEPTVLRMGASEEAEALAELGAGTAFWMLDDSLGWAWGYAGDDRRVGYIRATALA